MKISYKWLKEFVAFKESPEEIAQLLTFLGLESKVAEVVGSWKKVVTAKVLEIEKHPNADKLRVCTVTDGTQNYTIVCGAANVAAGQIVALALVDAELPGGCVIKKVTIRGKESQGMICSEKELGLALSSEDIMVLPERTPLGQSLEAVLEVQDSILEVEITTNRPDCLSHWGIAREIGAKLGLPVKVSAIPYPKADDDVAIVIDDSELCPKYTGAHISGIAVGPSPAWMARRLEKCGLRPINNIVDITNYVLLELGHPLHAFDRAKLAGERIIVRRANSGEKILALDGKMYALDDSMLVIADGEKSQAIAGIIGAEASGVTEKTREIILESALFSAASIRKTSKQLHIATDASYRFERGASWEIADIASYRAIDLITTLACGKLRARADKFKKPYVPSSIFLRLDRIKHLLNISVPPEEVKKYLVALGIEAKEIKGTLSTQIPSWRLDLKEEVDLIEEIARLNGFDKIPVTVPAIIPDMSRGTTVVPIEQIMREGAKALGFSEAINYSFTETAAVNELKVQSTYRISNPASKENELLRPTLLTGLLSNLRVNFSQGYESIQLYESGTIFPAAGEKKSFALIAYGPVWKEWWGWEQRNSTVPKYDYYFVSGALKNILGNRFTTKKAEECAPYFHPAKTSAVVIHDRIVGYFGMLRPEYSSEFSSEIGYAELDLQSVEEGWDQIPSRYMQLRRYPPVKRDLSLLADKTVSFESIALLLNEASAAKNDLQCDTELFSRFEDEAKLGPGKVSYSLHFVFRHSEHTLTDAEVNAVIDKILARLKKELNVTLRS